MSYEDIFNSYRNALERFKEVMNEPETALVRDAAIKRFEFTFELAWKVVQKFLSSEGITCRSPKGCFKEAFKFGVADDNPQWVIMIEDRNMTVHTYNEAIAKELYDRLKNYIPLFEGLIKKIR